VQSFFVPILYHRPALEAFGDITDFCKISKLQGLKNMSSSWFESMPGSHRARLCEDQEEKEWRRQVPARVYRGLPVATAVAAGSAHPTAHPEFVPIVFSSTDL
jgi:hypothetical protein